MVSCCGCRERGIRRKIVNKEGWIKAEEVENMKFCGEAASLYYYLLLVFSAILP